MVGECELIVATGRYFKGPSRLYKFRLLDKEGDSNTDSLSYVDSSGYLPRRGWRNGSNDCHYHFHYSFHRNII